MAMPGVDRLVVGSRPHGEPGQKFNRWGRRRSSNLDMKLVDHVPIVGTRAGAGPVFWDVLWRPLLVATLDPRRTRRAKWRAGQDLHAATYSAPLGWGDDRRLPGPRGLTFGCRCGSDVSGYRARASEQLSRGCRSGRERGRHTRGTADRELACRSG